jgi:hypothetical protein
MPVGNVSNQVFASEVAAPFEVCELSQADTSPATQHGCYGTLAVISAPFINLRVQPVPGLQRITLLPLNYDTYNEGIVEVGPQEFSAVISLSSYSPTIQLEPSYANCQQTPTAPISPAVPNFVYTSRNIKVCTVNSSGLVRAVGRGSCVILVGAYRGANAVFAGATPPQGNTGCEVFCELAVTVVA